MHYVLFAVLNWGLGHATRSIPLIHSLLKQKKQLFIASDGRALHLLKKEFPDVKFLELPAYQVSYPGSNMIWNMALQLPKIIKSIFFEHQSIKKYVEEHAIDTIIFSISPNEYMKLFINIMFGLIVGNF